jgi:hypothetical protein
MAVLPRREDPTMSDGAKEAGRRFGVWVWLALLTVPVLYVLSIGPAAMFVEKTGVGVEAVAVVYAPVVWLYQNTPLKKPLEAYMDLWVD